MSGSRLVVSLWNRSSKNATITVNWAALGLESSAHVSVRDLWKVSIAVLFNPVGEVFHIQM